MHDCISNLVKEQERVLVETLCSSSIGFLSKTSFKFMGSCDHTLCR